MKNYRCLLVIFSVFSSQIIWAGLHHMAGARSHVCRKHHGNHRIKRHTSRVRSQRIFYSQRKSVNYKEKYRIMLWKGVEKGDLALVKIAQRKGVPLSIRGLFGRTPLHEAALRGHFSIVSYLISQGVALNAKNNFGRTPLHLAAERCREVVIDALVRAGANLSARNNFGSTPRDVLGKKCVEWGQTIL